MCVVTLTKVLQRTQRKEQFILMRWNRAAFTKENATSVQCNLARQKQENRYFNGSKGIAFIKF